MRNPNVISATLAAVAMSLLLAGTARADERLTLTESVLVAAPASEAWAIVGDFAGLDAWHPAVTASELTNGERTIRGAMRVLTIGDGAGTITETLTAHDADAMSLGYVINSHDVLPVKDYASTMRVLSIGENSSLVIWSSTFQSALTDGQPDSAAVDGMRGVYRAGLDNLRDSLAE